MKTWLSKGREDLTDITEPEFNLSGLLKGAPISRFGGAQLGEPRCEMCGAEIEFGERNCGRCITRVRRIEIKKRPKKPSASLNGLLSLGIAIALFSAGIVFLFSEKSISNSTGTGSRTSFAASMTERDADQLFELTTTAGTTVRVERSTIRALQVHRENQVVDLLTTIGKFTIPYSEAAKLPRFYRRQLGVDHVLQ